MALNRRAAALMGINLSRVTTLSFAGGAAVAGLAGLLVSPNVSAHYLMGVPLAIQGFTALVIGGVGRVEGAILGGLVLAFAEQLTARYAPIPSGFAQGVPLVFLMICLCGRRVSSRCARDEGRRLGRGVVALAALPFFLGSYHNDVYRKLLWVTLALGYNFLFGICGQVAFSHFAFYGIGAYGVVILLFQVGLPLPIAIVLALLICVILALIVAIPATRLEGFYLAPSLSRWRSFSSCC